jgi:hypothetical protein
VPLISCRLSQLIKSIECRCFVALGQGWIVENGIHEVMNFAFQNEHGLTDMEQLRSTLSDDMYAKEIECFPMED